MSILYCLVVACGNKFYDSWFFRNFFRCVWGDFGLKIKIQWGSLVSGSKRGIQSEGLQNRSESGAGPGYALGYCILYGKGKPKKPAPEGPQAQKELIIKNLPPKKILLKVKPWSLENFTSNTKLNISKDLKKLTCFHFPWSKKLNFNS